MPNPEFLHDKYSVLMQNYIHDHRHRIRGGAPLFPKQLVRDWPILGLPGELDEDLLVARGDGRSFGIDLKRGKVPVKQVRVFNSLPYLGKKIGPDSQRYQRIAAIFAGRSTLAAVCHLHETTNRQTETSDVYRLNEGVLFLPRRVVPFDSSTGIIAPLTMPDEVQSVDMWIDQFLTRELLELEDSVSPEVDNYEMDVKGTVKQATSSAGRLAITTALSLFGAQKTNTDGGGVR